MTIPPEIRAALAADPAAAVATLRVLAEAPMVRPSVRVAARLALRRLVPPKPRRAVPAGDDAETGA